RVERRRRDDVDVPPPQLDVGGALGDPEAQLAVGPGRLDLPPGPAGRRRDGALEFTRRSVSRNADAEAQRDVGAEPALDLRDALGREARVRPVVDGAERDA